MSKKGQKGRSRKKASVGERRPRAAAVSVNEVVEASPPVALAPPVILELAQEALTEPPVVTALATGTQRPRMETPIAFAAPSRVEPPAEPEVSADASPPPVDLDSHFFATDVHAPDPADLHEERDPRMVLKLAPAAAKRRAQFQRYVKLAVGAASVLCLAALVKVAVAHNHEEPLVRRASASMQVAPPAATEVAPAETATAAAPSEPTADPTPAPTAAPVAADTATAITPDPAVPAEPDPKAAAKEKHASQLGLERGKVGESIEAGERSVALDPSDAEAWLILGAAYQEKGDAANARRSFKSCLSEGKRGPKWECAQFPH
jgi:hypothetical protein